MTDADRQYNGHLIEGLCRMSDLLLKSYGIGPERAKVGIKEAVGEFMEKYNERYRICEFCQGEGSVPANSGSDVADRRCPECKGKGTL